MKETFEKNSQFQEHKEEGTEIERLREKVETLEKRLSVVEKKLENQKPLSEKFASLSLASKKIKQTPESKWKKKDEDSCLAY